MNVFIKNNYKNIINNFFKFLKKSKHMFILAVIIIICIIFLYFYNLQEGMEQEPTSEQPTDSNKGGGATTFYDPTVKDKIADIGTVIEEKEIENKEKLAKINILVTDIETDINRIIDRDQGLAELINSDLQ